MGKKFWTGIGSRYNVSHELQTRQIAIGKHLSEKGWTLLTGGAAGSDFNFLQGSSLGSLCDEISQSHVIRPVNNKYYKGQQTITRKGSYGYPAIVEYMEVEDFERAVEYYFSKGIFSEKSFNKMSEIAQQLHARNFYQIMDEKGVARSELVVYSAPEDRWGNVSGGTRTAVAIARLEGVPSYNIKLEDSYTALQRILSVL